MFIPHKMAKLQSLRVFLNERLTAAVVEIFGAVENTILEYQEENDRLRRMLRITPEIQLRRIDSLQFSLSKEEVPPEQQHCEQEWSPSLWQEDPEATQIKEEQEELRNSQDEELGANIIEFKFPSPSIKIECDHERPFQSMTLPQTQTVENIESDSRPVDLQPFSTVTHLRGLDIPCEPPDSLNNFSSHSSALIRDPVGLASSLPLDRDPPMTEHHPKLPTMSRKSHQCQDCGEMFVLKADLQRHVTLTRKRPSECVSCKKRYNSTCKLKAHVRLCHSEKPGSCPVCGKTFKLKAHLSKHMRIHTGEKPFTCDECGKSFSQKGHLTIHKLTHTGEKPFSCADCGKSFGRQQHLTTHKLTHTGEKPFICGDCGKSFNRKEVLTVHIRTHTGEKPFNCGDCGKSFRHKGSLKIHVKSHTGAKSFTCGDCGKSFSKTAHLTMHIRTHTRENTFCCRNCGKSFIQKEHLTEHMQTHTEEKPFRCTDCGKSFYMKADLRRHVLTHTGEKPYVCAHCGRRFTQKTHLLRHMYNVHKGRKHERIENVDNEIICQFIE
ncbi:gastrula zinc finger protein XlCGF57.1-like [Esox lucius]|uniref:C2H2-type domain-containing protein n=1 Tax=Esox lucius TaxID=8010 RepID=A0AAY5L2J2_ESOLU|nr:gastrula zinc finger protein XlCGF57.1-like [Esox lucius]